MKIKFSHAYKKLLADADGHCAPVSRLKLLDVQVVQLEELTNEFINFDTDNGVYQLPEKGEYLMLIFLKPSEMDLCLTLRRATPNKYNYYRGAVGQWFDVEITEAQ